MARTMVPTAPPEVVLQLRLTQNLSFSFEHLFYSSWSVKLLSLCYLLCLCPSRGLAICVSIFRFSSTLFGPVSSRYGSAAAVC